MLARPAAVRQDGGVGAAGVLQGAKLTELAVMAEHNGRGDK
jgi:hypothetical protein